MKRVRTVTKIAAPIARVWETLTDFGGYGKWNPLIVDLRGKLEPGAPVDFYVELYGKRLPIDARMLRVDHERDFRWRGPRSALLGKVFSGEHYFTVESIDDDNTRFIHGEDFSGLALPLTWWRLEADVIAAYEGMNIALKRHLEG